LNLTTLIRAEGKRSDFESFFESGLSGLFFLPGTRLPGSRAAEKEKPLHTHLHAHELNAPPRSREEDRR